MTHLHQDSALAQFRSALLQRTQGVVRRRRWQRRGGLLVLAVLLYGAGFGSSQFFATSTPRLSEQEPTARETGSLLTAHEAADLAAQSFSTADPQELELAAELASLVERPNFLLRAGDAYLAQHGDIERALRCYRSYLAEAVPAAALDPVRREESWLLTALRQNRL